MTGMLTRWLAASTVICMCGLIATVEGGDWHEHPENQWVLQSPREGRSAPNFPYEGSGDYDPYLRRWIHHAGHDGIPQGFHTFTVDLDTGKWQQLFPPTSPPGVCCVDGTNVFDIAQRRFVRFPGGSLGHGFQWSRGVKLKESSVWLYDTAANSWMNMRPPPYDLVGSSRAVGGLNSGATYDPNHEISLSFGGQGSSGGKNTLFAYDAYANGFYLLDAADPPAARDGMGLAYDRRRDKLVMFGGQYLVDKKTWFYDLATNRWEGKLLDPHPPAHKVTKDYTSIPRLAYDSVNDVILCLAWLGEEKGHETWALDMDQQAWKKLSPATEPTGSKSRSRNLSFDAERNVFILESSNAKTNQPEIWTYRLRQAASLLPAVAPPSDLQVVTTATTVQLRWQPSTTADVKSYDIYRAQTDEPWKAPLVKIGSVAGTATAYVDKDIQPGQIYHYAVRAIGEDAESNLSFRARTQPRVLAAPVVSVLAKDRQRVTWDKHPTSDIVGYNLYRGIVAVATVTKGEPKAWRDNDPEYATPQVVKVQDITRIERLNEQPLAETSFDDSVDLAAKPLNDEYAFGVYAYIVRAVNALGVESGPSPYALTLPAEPLNVFCREQGKMAELKWDASREAGIVGYHVYRLKGTWEIERATDQVQREPTFREEAGSGVGRYWVVAIDALGQEGQPSSPVWFQRSFKGFYDGEWHQ